MREMHLFAGIGGGILGGILLGHTPVCAVEIDSYCMSILKQRIADGILPDMHLHDDIKTFDGMPWKGEVEAVCGGFPCTDISLIGKREGLHGKQSGLYRELVRIVREVEPEWVFLENVPALVNRGLDTILWEMAELGYDAAWTLLSAKDCGANHLRKRIWILCHRQDAILGDSKFAGLEGYTGAKKGICQQGWDQKEQGRPITSAGICRRKRPDWYAVEPNVGRLAHGIPNRVGRIKALGNAQVPVVAASAWKILEQMLRNTGG